MIGDFFIESNLELRTYFSLKIFTQQDDLSINNVIYGESGETV